MINIVRNVRHFQTATNKLANGRMDKAGIWEVNVINDVKNQLWTATKILKQTAYLNGLSGSKEPRHKYHGIFKDND